MSKRIFLISTCFMASLLSGCTYVASSYMGITPAVSPVYSSFGFGYTGPSVISTGFYGENPYWGVGYTNWYSPGLYYGPSIYSYDW